MGQSNDAFLVFGVDLGEDVPEFLEDFDGDMDDFVHSFSGLPSYGEPGHDFAKDREFREGYIVDLTLYCSYDYPMYIISLRDTNISASRGYAKEIDPETSFNIDPVRLAEFKAWLTDHGIDDEPKWFLNSMNG